MPPLNDRISQRKQLGRYFGGGSQHARSSSDPGGKEYWRSLNELANSAEFEELLQREFSSVAADVVEPSSRRDFLRFMGASLALAGIGLTSCRWPEEKITPFASKQEGYMHGVPVQFATAMDLGGTAVGLLATSYDGRPIKIEGNPLHPGSLGAASMLHQASVLDLYDANRSKRPTRRDKPGASGERSSFAEFSAAIQPVLSSARQQRGGRTAVLCEANSSPTRARLQQELAERMPLLQWYEYEPLSWDNQREGTRLVFGQPWRPHYDLNKAKVIVSFACDFLEGHPDSLKLARDWAKGRRAQGGQMNRSYVIEAGWSLSGAKADHRLPTRPSRIEPALYALAAAIGKEQGYSLPSALFAGAEAVFQADSGADKSYNAMVKDLLANRGASVVMAGPELSAQAHALVATINIMLGNAGQTLQYAPEEQALRMPHNRAIAELTGRVAAGSIDNLIIIGGNPAFDAPADLGFSDVLATVRHSVHLSTHDNETSQCCRWHLPRAHFLEEWSDALGYDGTYSIVQPLIEPLYASEENPLLSANELLAWLLDGTRHKGYELVRETFAKRSGASDMEAAWRETLHDGVLRDSAAPKSVPPVLQLSRLEPLLPAPEAELELLFMQDYSVYDGRYANNGWLQETPDPITKLTWDNACLVGVAEAARQGLKYEDIVELECNGQRLRLPVYVCPGLPDGVIAASLGYGRRAAGDVGNGVGVDLYPLRRSDSGGWASVRLSPTGGSYQLASTQDHHAIDMRGFEERGKRISVLVREANLDFYNEHPDFPTQMVHAPAEVQRWAPLDTSPDGRQAQHKWGMSIDLATCTGCSACIVACTAENNIPVVGKLRVRQGREMHWLRIDRYFRSRPEAPSEVPVNPRMAVLPMTCNQCELAPCEQVCPVNATTHSDEGLNDMVYNRCIGTRYCSNNCPFKVRRFNYFNYQKSLTETQKLVHNPEVTVRSRGVMEKCTYCVQRIQNHKIEARVSGRELQDGEIKTACQQTCPTEAIVFGDLKQDSRVRALREEYRSFVQLPELQLRPRTSYLAGLWNPAPGTDEFDLPAPRLFEHHGSGHGEGQHGEHEDHGHAASASHDEHAAPGEHSGEEAAVAEH